MKKCHQKHPDLDATCESTGEHHPHLAFVDGEPVIWPNEDWLLTHGPLQELAKRVPQESRSAPVSIIGGQGRSERPETSIVPNEGTHAYRVLVMVCQHAEQGLITDEIEDLTGIVHQSMGSPIVKLRDGGWILPGRDQYGRLVERPTKRGEDAQVWVPSPGAMSWYKAMRKINPV